MRVELFGAGGRHLFLNDAQGCVSHQVPGVAVWTPAVVLRSRTTDRCMRHLNILPYPRLRLRQLVFGGVLISFLSTSADLTSQTDDLAYQEVEILPPAAMIHVGHSNREPSANQGSGWRSYS